MTEWFPIETAPKDEEVLVWCICHTSGTTWMTFASWHDNHWCSVTDGWVSPKLWTRLSEPEWPPASGIETATSGETPIDQSTATPLSGDEQ